MIMPKIPISESNAFIEVFDLPPYQEGELSPLTFAVKDSIDIKGQKTGCGNPTWIETTPISVVNAPCVDQLLANGAFCRGKTICDEITFSLAGENVHYGTPLNPCDPERVPGGSSSGSASAVACGIVDFALGTDNGGSVRVPASNCGIFGMRPSVGAISTAGSMPLGPSFDTIGILAKSFEVLDKVASKLLCTDTFFEKDVDNIYLVKEAFALCDKEVRQAFEKSLSDLPLIFPGKVKEISLEMLMEEYSPIPLHHWLEIFTICQNAEIWSTHGAWVESAKPKLGPQIQANFDFAKNIDRTQLNKAIERREWYFHLMLDFLKPNDLLCFPTTPKIAPLKNSLANNRHEDDYYSKTISICSIAGICRLPQISMPLAFVDSVPVGLSFAAGHRQDAFLLSAVGKFLLSMH